MRNTKLDRLSPQPTLLDRAYETILAAICDGRLSPSERLNQDGLAARLQISRQPVGQALSILKSQGFVRDNGRRGLVIAPLEREFVRSIYQLREALDSQAARLASERCSPSDIAEGRRLLAEGRKAVQSESYEALIAADMRFHMWMYETAGNPLLVETMNHYWNHLRRAMGEILRYSASRRKVWSEHERLLKAIIERNAKTAERLALAHTRAAAEAVVESIPATTVETGGGPRVLPKANRAGGRRAAAPPVARLRRNSST